MDSTQTILIIDDDVDLCASIKNLLEQHGFNTILAHDSRSIESILKDNDIDLILLDIILPGGKDGIAICKFIRQLTDVPIIMLTGINTDTEEVVSLEVGADHYLTKPFQARVLLAYINVCLRRKKNAHTMQQPEQIEVAFQIYEFSGWILNVTARILLSPHGKVVKLTPVEFSLLQSLVERAQCVLSRNQLLDLINTDSIPFDRSVDIHISRLRAKMESIDANSKMITTIRNAGYSLMCTVTKRMIDSASWNRLAQ